MKVAVMASNGTKCLFYCCSLDAAMHSRVQEASSVTRYEQSYADIAVASKLELTVRTSAPGECSLSTILR